MVAKLHSKLTLGWDGKPEVSEHECKWVKVTGTKIEIYIHKYHQVIASTNYYDLEIID